MNPNERKEQQRVARLLSSQRTLPKKAEPQFETYGIESPHTSTNYMDHRLLEELVKLNRKQLYWIRIIGVFFLLALIGGILASLAHAK